MIQVAKIIGTGLATTGLIGAGVGIGVVFGVRAGFVEMMPLTKHNSNITVIIMQYIIPSLALGVEESSTYKHSMVQKVPLTGQASLHIGGRDEISMVKAKLLEVNR